MPTGDEALLRGTAALQICWGAAGGGQGPGRQEPLSLRVAGRLRQQKFTSARLRAVRQAGPKCSTLIISFASHNPSHKDIATSPEYMEKHSLPQVV